MWKIAVAFIVFAGASLFFIFKAGDKVDMQGEAGAHDTTEVHAASTATSVPAAVVTEVATSSASSTTSAGVTPEPAASK